MSRDLKEMRVVSHRYNGTEEKRSINAPGVAARKTVRRRPREDDVREAKPSEESFKKQCQGNQARRVLRSREGSAGREGAGVFLALPWRSSLGASLEEQNSSPK